MMYVNWSQNVNTKFYNLTPSIKDNSISNEYTSGRKTTILKNTRFVKELKLKITLNVKTGEYDAFVNWFTLTLGGLAGIFKCSSLGNGFYCFKSTPCFSDGLTYRTADLEIEEVY